ncbi:phosphate ABC transporter permease PstA [Ligilactobacillus salivarius]|uniref:phosphate ABC transporter permease PstA n=1 Tax=Ligilactobacillus salivarius TaxID=1624 RepID=UPI0020236ED1|nr:phosphate ABC transporter permease PstA [Ligilactobacillus salivarius]URI12358.1 phosphate ABC transporter permease PstA [Ligilactobacillus salivarius]UUB34183.1 phosphate ABC transporter permease PstA [Ligilactobacillus salivarius]
MNADEVDKYMELFIKILTILIVILLLCLLGYILFTGINDISWKFLTTSSASGVGIRDQIFNTVYLLILTTIISVPISLGVGIYLAEISVNNKLTNIIRTVIEVLSSLPSIVVGLFGYLLFVIQFHLGFSILSGAITLTFLNLPLLTRNVENSLKSVDDKQFEAGLSLGLSQWKTITGIVLPSAIPGILTGIILGAGRIFGEAAALIYTAGQSAPVIDYANWNPTSSNSFLNIMRPAETLAVHIWKINTEGVEINASQISAGASVILVIIVIFFNVGAHIVGNYVYRKLTSSKK